MDKHNIVPLRPEDVNPAIIIQELFKNVDKIDSIFVVAFDAEGRPTLYSRGDIKDLVYASFVLKCLAEDTAREYGEF